MQTTHIQKTRSIMSYSSPIMKFLLIWIVIVWSTKLQTTLLLDFPNPNYPKKKLDIFLNNSW
jgi:hypothetical protein